MVNQARAVDPFDLIFGLRENDIESQSLERCPHLSGDA
jgi:hypothetical protein